MIDRGRTMIKICGLRTPEAVAAVAESGADMAGFVHWAGSPRFVDLQQAEGLASGLPGTTSPVSLFVDERPERMLESPFEWIQLHGREDEEACRTLRRAGRRVIRGFRFDAESLERWDRCPDVDVLLVDGSETGGSGRTFDHRELAPRIGALSKPVIVAGGLHRGNVLELLDSVPCWGVDVSSGVEVSRGTKDPEEIRAFCRTIRPGG